MSINHEQRRKSLGASEVAAILGCNDNMTPLDVWLLKTGRKEAFEGNEHTRRGNRQERQILEWLGEELGEDWRMADLHPSGKGMVCKDSPIASATPDALFVDYTFYRMHGSVDNQMDCASFIKYCLHERQYEIELAEAKSTLVRIKSIEDLNPSHLIQCQWQMLCTGLKKCHLAIFGPMVSDYQRFEIAYDEAFAMELLQKATDWWERHVVGDVMPEPINDADAKMLWPVDDGTAIEAVPALYEAIGRYKELGNAISALEKERDALKDQITPAIGPAQLITYAGQKIATYKTVVRNDPPREAKTITYRTLRV